MAEIQTRKTKASVTAFLAKIKDEARRKDCKTLVKMMREATGAPARMWGPAIVGFGDIYYKGARDRGIDWFLVGFSPRKQNLTLYIMSGFEGEAQLMNKLGKHSTGRSCLYIKRLEDVDLKVLGSLISKGVKRTQKFGSAK